jgi:hypothetical protein
MNNVAGKRGPSQRTKKKLNTRTPCRTQFRILDKEEGMLGSTARDLSVGTQLLHAKYMTTGCQLRNSKVFNSMCGGVHRKRHLLLREYRGERVETDRT